MTKGNSRYPTIRMIRRVTITEDEDDELVVEDSGGTVTVQIDAGDYWCHRDVTFDTNYPSLYLEIENKLDGDSTLNGDYQFAALTPSGSDLTDSGVQLSADESFTLHFFDNNWTIDPRFFGFTEDKSTNESSNVDNEVKGEFSIYSLWQSPHPPDDLRAEDIKEIFASSETSRNKRKIGWLGPTRRRLRFYAVEGGHFRKGGADDSTVASQAGLPTGDTNNALQEFLFEAASDAEIFVVYDGGGLNIPNSQTGSEDKYERGDLMPLDMLERPLERSDDVEGKEKYSFDLALDLSTDSPRYDDT